MHTKNKIYNFKKVILMNMYWAAYSISQESTRPFFNFGLGKKGPWIFQISKDHINLVINTALFSMTGFKGTDVLWQLMTSRETRQWRKWIYKRAQQNKKACIHTILWRSSFFFFFSVTKCIVCFLGSWPVKLSFSFLIGRMVLWP